jgi:hypothetical protein
MRLINLKSLELEDFLGANIPPYAILSHTWGDGEVTLQHFLHLPKEELKKRLGWKKIANFCRTALMHAEPLTQTHVEYGWVDTCCIDKTSSAELSEAINSMFPWYRAAVSCFAYLPDVAEGKDPEGNPKLQGDFEASRWFTRGWTLQELLAPPHVAFFDKNWSFVGDKSSLAARIALRTNIDEGTIRTGQWTGLSVAKRMSWAASRETTRIEDIAYCLLGLFDVNMPLLYGEGEKAFIRLQEEIMRESDDQSIFAWDASSTPPSVQIIGVLATSPSQFRDSSNIEAFSSAGQPLVVTNKGLQMSLPVVQQAGTNSYLGILACSFDGDVTSSIAIPLEVDAALDRSVKKFSRGRHSMLKLPSLMTGRFPSETVLLCKRNQAARLGTGVATCWLKTPLTSFPYHSVRTSPVAQWNKNNVSLNFPKPEEFIVGLVAFRCNEGRGGFVLVLYMNTTKNIGQVGLVELPDDDFSDDQLEITFEAMSSNAKAIAKSNNATSVLGKDKITAQLAVQAVHGRWVFMVTLTCSTPARS